MSGGGKVMEEHGLYVMGRVQMEKEPFRQKESQFKGHQHSSLEGLRKSKRPACCGSGMSWEDSSGRGKWEQKSSGGEM